MIVSNEKKLALESLLSLRKKVSNYQAALIIQQMKNYMAQLEVTVESLTTIIFNKEKSIYGTEVIDMELLFSVRELVPIPDEYIYKKNLNVSNLLCVQFDGKTTDVSKLYSHLFSIIKVEETLYEDPLYIVTKKPFEKTPDEISIEFYLTKSEELKKISA